MGSVVVQVGDSVDLLGDLILQIDKFDRLQLAEAETCPKLHQIVVNLALRVSFGIDLRA